MTTVPAASLKLIFTQLPVMEYVGETLVTGPMERPLEASFAASSSPEKVYVQVLYLKSTAASKGSMLSQGPSPLSADAIPAEAQLIVQINDRVPYIRGEGCMIRPITLFPFPKKAIDGLDYGRVKGIIDLEMAIPAQMRDDIELQVCRRCPVYEYGRSGGVLLDDETTKAAVLEIIKGGEQ